MLEELRRHAAEGDNFAFETRLAGRGYARPIPQWQTDGYWVHLTFLWLPSAELAVQRVAKRVAQGDVAEKVIRRRFAKGFRKFQNIYRKLVHSWQLYDNSGEQPILLDQFP